MHCWDPLTALDESLRIFDDLVRWGKVRYIGVSNFKAWQIMKALVLSERKGWKKFIAAQYQYSLVVRDIETEFVELCQSEGIGLVPWGALGGGFLSGKYTRGKRPEVASDGRLAVMTDETEEAWPRRNKDQNWQIMEVFKKISEAHSEATYSQIALAWLLSRETVDSVLIGVRTMDQLLDNLGATDLVLSAEEIAELDEVSATELGYPYRFLLEYGTRE